MPRDLVIGLLLLAFFKKGWQNPVLHDRITNGHFEHSRLWAEHVGRRTTSCGGPRVTPPSRTAAGFACAAIGGRRLHVAPPRGRLKLCRVVLLGPRGSYGYSLFVQDMLGAPTQNHAGLYSYICILPAPSGAPRGRAGPGKRPPFKKCAPAQPVTPARVFRPYSRGPGHSV